MNVYVSESDDDIPDSFLEPSPNDSHVPTETYDPPQPFELEESTSNTRYEFYNTNPGQKGIPFSGLSGLRRTAETPIEFFRLIANDTFFDHIISETNVYGDLLKNSSTQKCTRIKAWKPTYREEFEAFLALLYMMGEIVAPEIPKYCNM